MRCGTLHLLQEEFSCSLPLGPCSLSLLQDLAHRLSALREVMPSTNLSKLVSSIPSMILDYEPDDLAARLDVLR